MSACNCAPPDNPSVIGAAACPTHGLKAVMAERDQLRALVDEFAHHDSWRCAYPPHYYLADGPPEDGDCPCGLVNRLKAIGLDPDGRDVF